MNGLRGLAWLLAMQSLGELLSRGLNLPFPGPVIGMLLLLLALRDPVAACADFLLAHLDWAGRDRAGAQNLQGAGECLNLSSCGFTCPPRRCLA